MKSHVLTRIEAAAHLYHRLVLVVGPSGSGKTRALRAMAQQLKLDVINLNLEVSKALLDLTERERQLKLTEVLGSIAGEAGDPVFLDNTEVLFDVSLKHDPLRLLQGLSRQRTVVASWNSESDGDWLTYAEPGHPEFCRLSTDGAVILEPQEVLR